LPTLYKNNAKSVSNQNIVLACSADCPADNHARPLAQFLYETLYTIRKMKFRTIFIILILTFFSCKTAKVETKIEQPKTEIITSEFPQQVGFVNDFEKIFTDDDIKFLENALKYYQDNSNREIAIITIESIPENTEFIQYAIRMSDNWNVGKNNDGNGLTIVLSKKFREIRISTTEKTRNYLTDEFCKQVIDKIMIPEFKKGNYNDGILLGLNELMRKWI